MFDYENEGCYCIECDRSYSEDEIAAVQVAPWVETFECPNGHRQRAFLNGEFYELGFYLLSFADDTDFAWPGFYMQIPEYKT